MSELLIIEDDNKIVVLSPYFSAGKGFIFPYGQFGEGIMEETFAFPSQEPELFHQAQERLDSLQVKRPTLKELLEIYSFVSAIPESLLTGKFVNLFRCYPFFAFNPFAYIPKTEEIRGVGEDLEKIVAWKASDFYTSSNKQKLDSNQVLLNIIGNHGIESLTLFCRNTRSNYFWQTEINEVATCVLRGSEKEYSSDWVKGFPIVQLESSGVGEFAFYGGTDSLKLMLDFWPNKEAQAYGYTFGIIE